MRDTSNNHLPFLINHLDPELQLLICCARLEMKGPFRSHAVNLLKTGLNWQKLEKAAASHGMTALLDKHLDSSVENLVPERTRQWLLQQTKALKAHQLFMTARMLKISRRLSENDIPHLHYKGIVLDHLLYGGESLRPTGDMDILVRKEDVHEVKALLLSEGYQPCLVRHKQQEAVVLRRYKDYTFFHSKFNHLVEVHWSITPKEISSSLDWNYFRGQSESCVLLDIRLETFCPEDMLLTLCIHAAGHQFEAIKWLCDIGQVFTRYPHLDLELVLQKARDAGLQGMVLLSLELVQNLVGAEILSAASVPTTNRLHSSRLSTDICHTLNEGVDQQSVFQRVAYKIQLLDRWQNRLRFLYIMAVDLNASDVEHHQLHPLFSPLFYVLRAIRLLRRRGFIPLWQALTRLLWASCPSPFRFTRKFFK